jgi:hypothetical protein
VHKGSTQINKKIKVRVQIKGVIETEEYLGLAYRTVSSALGPYHSELFTFGFLQRRSAIIHRTVRCTNGATALQRNGRLHSAPDSYSSRQKSEQRSEAHRIVNSACPVPPEVSAPTVVCIRTLTVGWRGWRTGHCPVAHRTVRCAHRQQHPNSCFGGWGL